MIQSAEDRIMVRQKARKEERRSHTAEYIQFLLDTVIIVLCILILAAGFRLVINRGKAQLYERLESMSTTVRNSDRDLRSKRKNIAGHSELYSEELCELAKKNDDAVDYVYEYPDKKGTGDRDLTVEPLDEEQQASSY